MAELKSIDTIKDNPETLDYVFTHEGEEHHYHVPRRFTPEEVDNTVLSFINQLENPAEVPEAPKVSDLTTEKVQARVDGRELEGLTSQLQDIVKTLEPKVQAETAAVEQFSGLTDEQKAEAETPHEKPETPFTDLVEQTNTVIEGGDLKAVREQVQTVKEAVSNAS